MIPRILRQEPTAEVDVSHWPTNASVAMDRVERYRGHAAECVRLAQQSSNQADKKLLLEMANLWIELAEQAGKKKSSDDPETD